MKTLLIDDEDFALRYLERLCKKLPELEITGCFTNALEALDFMREQEIDLIITDIEMPGMNGLDAVRQIRKVLPEAAIIFITAFEQYALQAFQAEAVAYLMKPCALVELQNAVRRTARFLPEKKKRVEIVTFGYFQLYIDGHPVRIANQKAKELLAFLVDREGAVVTLEQATGILWEGRPFDDAVKRLYRKATAYLHELCRERETPFFTSDRGSCHVVPTEFTCDYYRLLRGDKEAGKLYSGEYMSQYSWAEPTVGRIEQLLSRE